jgi:hypothetical protein
MIRAREEAPRTAQLRSSFLRNRHAAPLGRTLGYYAKLISVSSNACGD